jgi:hypothetical protein
MSETMAPTLIDHSLVKTKIGKTPEVSRYEERRARCARKGQLRRVAFCGILHGRFAGRDAGFLALRPGGDVGRIRGSPLVRKDLRTERGRRIEHGGHAGTCRFLGHGKSDFHGETAEIF